MDYQTIKSKRLVKKAIIKAAYKAGETHVGSALSCAEIMEALYFRVANVTKDNCKSETRDRILFIGRRIVAGSSGPQRCRRH